MLRDRFEIIEYEIIYHLSLVAERKLLMNDKYYWKRFVLNEHSTALIVDPSIALHLSNAQLNEICAKYREHNNTIDCLSL